MLKAKLLECGVDPPRTHDLVILAEMLPHSDITEIIAKKVTLFLTYGVEIRYPSIVPASAISEEEAVEAYDTTLEIAAMIHEEL